MRTRAFVRTLALVLSLLPAAASGQEPDLSAVRIEPARPTPDDPVRIAVTVGMRGDPDLHLVEVQGNRIVFHYEIYDWPSGQPMPPLEAWTAEETVGPLPAGIYIVEVRSGAETHFQRSFEVAAHSSGLVLQEREDGKFIVTVDFDAPQSSNPEGIGYGVPLTRESGYFWFFSPENVELTVKVLDGRGTNGRWWVFLASMTDLPFTVTVLKCPPNPTEVAPCNFKTYTNPRGVNRNILDTDAFPEL